MNAFYRDRNGDYLAIDTSTAEYYRLIFGEGHFEGRATAIAGQVGSVCTTGICKEFLARNCKPVAKRNVPQKWRKAIGY